MTNSSPFDQQHREPLVPRRTTLPEQLFYPGDTVRLKANEIAAFGMKPDVLMVHGFRPHASGDPNRDVYYVECRGARQWVDGGGLELFTAGEIRIERKANPSLLGLPVFGAFAEPDAKIEGGAPSPGPDVGTAEVVSLVPKEPDQFSIGDVVTLKHQNVAMTIIYILPEDHERGLAPRMECAWFTEHDDLRVAAFLPATLRRLDD